MYLYEYEAISDAIRTAGDFYEAPILDDIARCLPPQRTIVDVGANIGNHSLYWAAFANPDLVVAVEPVMASYALLCLNTHDYPAVRTVRSALSDHDGVERMTLDPVNMGRSRVARRGLVAVRSMRMDDLGLTDVSLVKIDVEGHQAQVLRGGIQTLGRDHPDVLIEDEDGSGAGVLEGLGYHHEAEWPGANHLWQWTP